MKILSTKAHGVLDYLMSILIIASPWIFNFTRGGDETWVPVIVGAAGIVYSLFTNYEMGAFRTLSMRSHLTLDMLAGAFLAVSPWVFGFNDYVYLPHLVFGLLEMGAALMTDPIVKSVNTHTSNADSFRTSH
jgi:hypothetical protein